MLFSAPVSFDDALASRRVKAILPTTGSSADLARLAPAIRERAAFSARTVSAQHLARINDVIDRILDPDHVTDPVTGQRRPVQPGERVNEARGRELLRESLRSIGYSPSDVGARPGTLQDLGSERRLNTIIDTNVAMARGYGWFAQGQNAAVLDQWPAQELVRYEQRTEPRDWHTIWRSKGGMVYRGIGLDGKEGRLVALKDDPIWERINEDFGLPYPPFAWGSGVGVEDVDRDTAVALGLIAEDAQIEPQDRGFNDDLHAALSAMDRQSALFAAIRDLMGDSVEIDGDVLRFRRAA
jgi:hypothetical protein